MAGSSVSASAVRAAHEIRTVVGRLRRRLRQEYDTSGLTPSQTSVLSRLDKDGDASVSELAAAERVRHQSMTSVVAVLEQRGLVVRRPDPEDGRRQLVTVTEEGRTFLADQRRAGEEWLARVCEDKLTEAERQTVLDAMALLERIYRS
ncbi:MarR family winged helix-turn-helix transcriptional regulator [Amycolatopsis sacchari]|uniref:MarR family winged helix-turn-helix transcriptional regulator n=1 Tax=Amycolatopsis sacchari TaxID=115433 RepID=UPI000B83A76F|nr:MarR family transcriptional regulator [Amycolatopsis sacchari]